MKSGRVKSNIFGIGWLFHETAKRVGVHTAPISEQRAHQAIHGSNKCLILKLLVISRTKYKGCVDHFHCPEREGFFERRASNTTRLTFELRAPAPVARDNYGFVFVAE